MQKAKIVEIFYSIQGEGKLAGKPSIFIRFFGCTLNCPGFGVSYSVLKDKLDRGIIDSTKDYKNWEVEKIAKEHKEGKYNSVKELPLTSTGCDSYCSWHRAFEDLTEELDPADVADRIIAIEQANINHALLDTELVFTGGEPLLYQGFICDVCSELHMRGAPKINVTFETNGTLLLNEGFKDQFFKKTYTRVLFSVSPKLSNSGCSKERTFKPGVVASYYDCKIKPQNDVYLKFVIDAKMSYIAELTEYVDRVKEETKLEKIEIFLMPAGGQYNEYYLKNSREVANICLEKGFRYSPRLQVDLFKNEWGT